MKQECVCPSCRASYHIDESRLGQKGRCKCGLIFDLVTSSHSEDSLVALADAEDSSAETEALGTNAAEADDSSANQDILAGLADGEPLEDDGVGDDGLYRVTVEPKPPAPQRIGSRARSTGKETSSSQSWYAHEEVFAWMRLISAILYCASLVLVLIGWYSQSVIGGVWANVSLLLSVILPFVIGVAALEGRPFCVGMMQGFAALGILAGIGLLILVALVPGGWSVGVATGCGIGLIAINLLYTLTLAHPQIRDNLRGRYGQMIRGLVLGFVLSPVLASANVGLAVAGVVPVMAAAFQEARLNGCRANLGAIHAALGKYAAGNNGRYPKTLDRLYTEGVIDAYSLRCPVTSLGVSYDRPDEGETGSYVLVFGGGVREAYPPHLILCHDNPDNHDEDGVNVLYGSGEIKSLSGMQFSTELAAAKQWLAERVLELKRRKRFGP